MGSQSPSLQEGWTLSTGAEDLPLPLNLCGFYSGTSLPKENGGAHPLPSFTEDSTQRPLLLSFPFLLETAPILGLRTLKKPEKNGRVMRERGKEISLGNNQEVGLLARGESEPAGKWIPWCHPWPETERTWGWGPLYLKAVLHSFIPVTKRFSFLSANVRASFAWRWSLTLILPARKNMLLWYLFFCLSN